MDFLDLMHTLFDLQEKFPGLTWEAGVSYNGLPHIAVTLPIEHEHVGLLHAGSRMFAPAD